MRVTIFDYGAGNLHSLAKAFASTGTVLRIEADPLRAIDTDLLVLPGVGAFGAAAARLAPARGQMREAILSGLPTLGICLGMQLLFDCSDEGPGAGLGIIPGRVERLRGARVPQIGWNQIEMANDDIAGMEPLEMAYFANSFVCRPCDERNVVAWSTHERDRFPAAVRASASGACAFGVQFHPEKSSVTGVRFLHSVVRTALVEISR